MLDEWEVCSYYMIPSLLREVRVKWCTHNLLMINYLEGSKTQETPKPNSYVAQEQKLGSKEFTLEFGSKVWKSDTPQQPRRQDYTYRYGKNA